MRTSQKTIQVLNWFIIILIVGCAPGFSGKRVSIMSKRQVNLDSQEKIKEIERSNLDENSNELLYSIRHYIGTPYKFGGDSYRGMDCSGFVATVFKESYNIDLPHSANQIYQRCQKIPTIELNLGDLVFFNTNQDSEINHVGIYLTKGYFAHASISYGVVISNLGEDYYRSRYFGAGRVVE